MSMNFGTKPYIVLLTILGVLLVVGILGLITSIGSGLVGMWLLLLVGTVILMAGIIAKLLSEKWRGKGQSSSSQDAGSGADLCSRLRDSILLPIFSFIVTSTILYVLLYPDAPMTQYLRPALLVVNFVFAAILLSRPDCFSFFD
ncbi:MAG: hypothetical protein JHC26_07005 [Thermofilum sp.]|jgi:hypothetical protein|uniref:hypothetical protein n=1 Tax=Thermofilum sp. TaxID=1961369 RepID=UPI0025898523|nr:hypothetical protein [Thermofilum sp.]MCI4408824.1 hypothetical protein [Thermofilum sp.]